MADLTYPEVRGTCSPLMPVGYHHLENRRVIGRGPGDFARAGEAVMRWEVQRGAGLNVRTVAERAVEGAMVTVRLGIGRFAAEAPCLVVYTVEEARRCGFAYGTLAGHPERGEELFLVEMSDDETVTLTIRAFSRPALWWSRAAGPAARLVQRLVTMRYLRSLDG